MKGYVADKGKRWDAVIHDGRDPITGRNDDGGIWLTPTALRPTTLGTATGARSTGTS